MSSAHETPPQNPTSHEEVTPPPVPKPRHLRVGAPEPSSKSPKAATRSAVFSKYLMNDIPRGTTYSKLINSLIAPPLGPTSWQAEKAQPHAQCGLVMSDSRLDDELSVAKIEFSDTPEWLQTLNYDPNGFPKKTTLGTLWRFADMSARDADGKTEFIRAVIKGKEHMDLFYPEMLAEFDDVDVNIQDARGRTALHWACEGKLENMVRLCLSVPECDVGLKNNEGLTAFDISLRSGQEAIPGLFYHSIFNMEQTHPQAALLRVLTFTDSVGDTMGDRPLFPGEAMFDPIEDRNMPLVTALLSRRVDLTARNKDGNTALHVAALQVGSADIARKLLEAGADINAIWKGGATPLQHAASTTDKEMLQVLLDWKSNVTPEYVDNRTALELKIETSKLDALIEDYQEPGHANEAQVDSLIPQRVVANITEKKDGLVLMNQAVMAMLSVDGLRGRAGLDALRRVVTAGDLDGTDVLLELGINTESGDREGKTVLHLAAERGHNAVVKMLLAAGAKIEARTNEGFKALEIASKNGHDHVVQTLLAAGANIETEVNHVTALMQAAENGHDLVIRALLTAGANIEATAGDWGTALMRAAGNGHNPVVQTLLTAGANIQARAGKYTALVQAAEKGHDLVVQALLTAGADIEATAGDWGTALLQAAGNGHNPVVQTLVAAGANTEPKESGSVTALIRAAANGHAHVVQTLIAAGASIEARAGMYLALVQAAERGHDRVVRALLTGGANIEATAGDWGTALMRAAGNGHDHVVQTLLSAGANTEPTEGGWGTALIRAAQGGHGPVVQALLAAGADINALVNGRSALQWASINGHKPMVKILRDAGALTRAPRVRNGLRQQLRR